MLSEPAAQDWSFPRSSSGIALLVDFGLARGLREGVLLHGTGLGAADLVAPEPEVTAAQELRVVRNLRNLRRFADDLGVEVGRRYQPRTFGAFGYALLASETVGEAMDFALRYIDLSFAFAIPRADLEGDEVVVTIEGGGLPDDVRRFLVARDATAIHQTLSGLVPGGVGAALRLEPDRAVLRFAVTELARPLPRGARDTSGWAELCADLVASRRGAGGLVQDVRVLVAQHLPSGAPLPAVAATLGLSERTLRRRLVAEGTTYREVLAEVRGALARSLLESRASLSVEGLATRLGYASATSFGHAFRAWTGSSPAAYRAGCE